MKFILPQWAKPNDYLTLQLRNPYVKENYQVDKENYLCNTITVQTKDVEAICDLIASHYKHSVEAVLTQAEFGHDGHIIGRHDLSILKIYPQKPSGYNTISVYRFWDIVDTTRGKTYEETCKNLKVHFHKKRITFCESWDDYLSMYLRQLETDHMASICNTYTGYCSDDHFESFCYGIIARGRKAYEAIIGNPCVEELERWFDNPKECSFEMYGFEVRQLIDAAEHGEETDHV